MGTKQHSSRPRTSSPCSFFIFFQDSNFHHISVRIHGSKSALARHALSLGMDKASYCGFCEPRPDYGADLPIATIHLSADNLTIDTIAHESTHAAFFRSEHFGHYKNSSDYQERLASDTGLLTEAIIQELKRRRFKLKNEPPITLNKHKP